MKNIFTVRDKQGNVFEIDPSRIKRRPLIHESLPEPTLLRIKAVYNQFRGLIPMVYEQFEFGFQFDEEPLKEVALWETISLCSSKTIAHIGDTPENRRFTYQHIHMLLMGAIPDEKLQTEEIRFLKRMFSEAHYELQRAA
jgi:hypothetical protein